MGWVVGKPVEVGVGEDEADRPWLLLFLGGVGDMDFSYVKRVMNGFNCSAIFGCFGILIAIMKYN